MTLAQTTEFATQTLQQPGFRGEQIWRWVHREAVSSIDEMTNLSKSLRETLGSVACLGTLRIDEVQRAKDGTRKIRLLTRDDRAIESVLIPDGDKLTQCISSQVGCGMGCEFCATAKMGLSRNLDSGEIVDQVYRAQQVLDRESIAGKEASGRKITNLVYMGMGEPLHNYDNVMRSIEILIHELGANLSQRRITVSTVGLVPAMERLGKDRLRPNLAISLNASQDQTRSQIMPVNRKYDLATLIATVKRYPLEKRRRITFEYVLLAGVNDTSEDARRLGKLLRGLRCKVNIIPWNPHSGAPFERPSQEAILGFQEQLKALGLPTYLRTPRGDDIDAACGQLAAKRLPVL